MQTQPTKPKIELTAKERVVMSVFDNWLKDNPTGGLFIYGDIKFKVTPKK